MEDPQELQRTKEKLEAQLSEVNQKLSTQESNKILEQAQTDAAWEELSWSDRLKVRERNPEAFEHHMSRMLNKRYDQLENGAHGMEVS